MIYRRVGVAQGPAGGACHSYSVKVRRLEGLGLGCAGASQRGVAHFTGKTEARTYEKEIAT
jgi:hypothetical protein